MWEGVRNDNRFDIVATPTAATRSLRVRVDQDTSAIVSESDSQVILVLWAERAQD